MSSIDTIRNIILKDLDEDFARSGLEDTHRNRLRHLAMVWSTERFNYRHDLYDTYYTVEEEEI